MPLMTTGAGVYPAAGGGGDAPQTTAFLAAVASAGTTLDATHTNLYKAMINGLVSDGVLALMDVLYVLATQDQTTAKINICNPSTFGLTLSPSPPPTFTADQGYTFGGVSDYLDTGFNISTAGGNASLNSLTLFGYNQTAYTAGSHGILGAHDAENAILDIFETTNSTAFLNGGGTSFTQGATAAGSWVASRTGASAVSLRRNTSSLGTNTTASTGMPNVSMYIGNVNGLGAWATACQMSAAGVGGGLTSTQMDALSNRVNTFMAGLATPKNLY